MKRPAEDTEDIEAKRARVADDDLGDSDPFHPTLRRSANELLSGSPDLYAGYVSGTVFMVWRPNALGRKMTLNTKNGTFEVSFTGACIQHIDLLDFDIGDTLKLRLKEAQVEEIKRTTGIGALPLRVKFASGFAFQYTLRVKKADWAGRIVDTWNIRIPQAAPPDQDDWFSTPAERPGEAVKGRPSSEGESDATAVDPGDAGRRQTLASIQNNLAPDTAHALNSASAASRQPAAGPGKPGRPPSPMDVDAPPTLSLPPRLPDQPPSTSNLPPVLNFFASTSIILPSQPIAPKAAPPAAPAPAPAPKAPTLALNARPSAAIQAPALVPNAANSRQPEKQLPPPSAASAYIVAPARTTAPAPVPPAQKRATDVQPNATASTSTAQKAPPAPRQPTAVPQKAARLPLPAAPAPAAGPSVQNQTQKSRAPATPEAAQESNRARKRREREEKRLQKLARRQGQGGVPDAAKGAPEPEPELGQGQGQEQEQAESVPTPVVDGVAAEQAMVSAPAGDDGRAEVDMPASYAEASTSVPAAVSTPAPVASSSRVTISAPAAAPPVGSIIIPSWSGAAPESSPAQPVGARYPPLNRLSERKGKYNTVDIVGVVSQVKPAKSNMVTEQRTDKWSKTFRIVDQSMFNAEVDAHNFRNGNAGVLINCFSRKYEAWLPNVQVGDIVLLQHMRVDMFNGRASAVGRGDKVQWTVFDPASSAFREPVLPPGVPRADFIGGGDDDGGAPFSPFWCAPEGSVPLEVERCAALAEWWKETDAKMTAAMGTVHQIGSGAASTSGAPKRGHMRVEQASPNLPTGGYFDCTVEVLHSHRNVSGPPYSLYVTDYTPVRGGVEGRGTWCPELLRDRVLRIEMWDSAADAAPHMAAGEIYRMRNVRMLRNRNGYFQGKAVDSRKIAKLQTEVREGEEMDKELKEFLDRREEWLDKGTPSTSPHLLIRDVDLGVWFSCTVELLLVAQEQAGPSLYVTDYTSNPAIPPHPAVSGQPWTAGLDGQILEIQMRDEQRQHTAHLQPGFYRIDNMRVKNTTTTMKSWTGRIGGAMRQVNKLNLQRPNEELAALLRRKEALKSLHRSTAAPGEVPSRDEPAKHDDRVASSTVSRQPRTKRASYMTIQEAQAVEECPNKFRLAARVVDFFPLALEDCAVLRCCKCKHVLPERMRRCIECNEDDEVDAQWVFRFFVRFEDAQGAQLTATVFGRADDGADGTRCALLDGLRPANLHHDEAALEALRAALRPLVGNLEEVHRVLMERNERVEHRGAPMLEVVVDCWPTQIVSSKDSSRAYDLIGSWVLAS